MPPPTINMRRNLFAAAWAEQGEEVPAEQGEVPAEQDEEVPQEAPAQALPMAVWVQMWERAERGWGKRPDGYTLHRERGNVGAFVDDMRTREAALGYGPDNVPESYSRPLGEPYQATIDDAELIIKVIASQHGAWGPGRNPPAPEPGEPHLLAFEETPEGTAWNVDGVQLVPRPEWIPVGERLPEIGQEVLIFANRRGIACFSVGERGLGSGWRTSDSRASLMGAGVTHWMPLPEPPGVS
jgi:hypothetical protein